MKLGKYHALFNYLSTYGGDEITLSLEEIENLLQEDLPVSAHHRRDWWGNRNQSPQAIAWMNTGFKVIKIDLDNKKITFSKPLRQYEIRRDGDIVLWDGNLIKALRQHMNMNQVTFAKKLGVRQQTISEWETGAYEPSRANCKYLMLVAEQANFTYGEEEKTSA